MRRRTGKRARAMLDPFRWCRTPGCVLLPAHTSPCVIRTAEENVMNCPSCSAAGTVSVRLVLVAKPLGTFSLAGAQTKMSAVTAAVAECSACGLTVSGRLENATLSDDGRTFTGGHFVSGEVPDD